MYLHNYIIRVSYCLNNLLIFKQNKFKTMYIDNNNNNNNIVIII